MSEQWPTTQEYRRLFDLAARVKELAPWTFMEEIDIFGVRNPETGEIGMVSIMGALGEHLAVAAYQGPLGLDGFQAMQRSGPDFDADMLLEIPQLQASFENREDMLLEERDLIKQLGYRFRGQHAWPAFRSYRPGYVPFGVDSAEARFLAYVLEQVLEVAPRFRENRELFRSPVGRVHLVRVPQQSDQGLTWHDEIVTIPPYKPPVIHLTMDMKLLEELKRQSKSKMTIETDLFIVPGYVRESKTERPRLVYMLLTVESTSGFVLGADAMTVQPTPEAMWGEVPLRLAQTFAEHQLVPSEVNVRRPLMNNVLRPLADELHLKLRLRDRLPALEEAEESLNSVMRSR